MLIELQPMGRFPTPASIGVIVGVVLLAIALFVLLRRQGKPVQAVAAPLVLLMVFFGILQQERRKVYSLEHQDASLVLHTLMGPQVTACKGIEFLVRRTRSGCHLLAYRGDEEIFHSVSIEAPRCPALVAQLRQMPCKPSDVAPTPLAP